MTLGYDGSLYVLAFDHRGSFQKMFGVAGTPNAEETERISDGKRLIFEGFEQARADGADRSAAGMLVDEQFGGELARQGKEHGAIVAMPVEKSGQDEFDFEYGEDFSRHILAFDPTFSKVLVRYNPHGDAEMNARQVARLKRLSDWLHEHDRRFLFELLVPAEPDQLEQVGGDAGRFDTALRPGLMVTSIWELQESGVEPDIWKIEGIDAREDCVRIATQVRAGGRDHVACIVLGRGADEGAVIHWLQQGAGVPGYVGFAIGRTIWSGALKAFLAGEMPRESAAKQIAANYRKMIDVYTQAGSGTSG